MTRLQLYLVKNASASRASVFAVVDARVQSLMLVHAYAAVVDTRV